MNEKRNHIGWSSLEQEVARLMCMKREEEVGEGVTVEYHHCRVEY